MIQGPEAYAPRRLATRIAAVYGGSEDEWLATLRQALSDDALARDMWTKAIVADEAFADTKLDDFRQWLSTVSFDTEEQVDTGERTSPALPDIVEQEGLDDAALLLPDAVPQDATSINVPLDPIIAQDPETFKAIPAGGNTFVPVNAKLAERAGVITEAIIREDPPEDVGGALEWYRRNVGLPFGQTEEADLYLSGYYKDRLSRAEEADVMASITNELGNATAMSLLILSDQLGDRADEVNDLLNRAVQGDQQAMAQLFQLRDSDPLVAEYLRAYEASAKVARLGKRVQEDYSDELAEVERRQINGWAQDVRYHIWGKAPVIGPPATMYFKVVRPAVATAMRFGSNLLGSTALIIENLRQPLTGPTYGPDTDFREYISRIGNPERYSWLATPATESVGIVREVVELDPDHYVALNASGKPAYVMDARGVPYHPEKAKEVLDAFEGDFNALPRRTAFDWGSVLPTAASGLTETVLIGYLARGLRLGRVSPLAERLSITGAAFMSSYNAYYEEGLRRLGPLRASEANAYALGAALGEGLVEAINPLEARITAPSPKSVLRTLRRSSSVEGLGRLASPSPGTIALGRLRNAAQQGLFESFEGVASQLWGTGIAAAVNATALQDSFKRLDSDVSFTELMNAALSEGLGALIAGGSIAYHPSATHIEALLHVDRNRAVLDYIDKRDPTLGETVRRVLDRADAMAKREAPAGLRERAQQLVQAHGEVVLGKAAEEAAAFAEEAVSNAAPEPPQAAGVAALETQRAMFLQGRPGAKVRSRGGVEYELVRTESGEDGERRYVIRVDGESTIIMGEADYVRSVNDLFDEIIVATHGNEGLARAQEIRDEVEAAVRAGEEVAAATTRIAEEEDQAGEEDDDVPDTVDPFEGGAPALGEGTSPRPRGASPQGRGEAQREAPQQGLPAGDAAKGVRDVVDAAAQGLMQEAIEPVIEMAEEGDPRLDDDAAVGARVRPAIEAQGVDTSALTDAELGAVVRDIAHAELRGEAVDADAMVRRLEEGRRQREEEERRREEARVHGEALREEAGAFVEDVGADVEVVVVASYDELAPEDREAIPGAAFAQMEAAIITERGRVVVNARNVRSRQRLREVLLHEVVAHHGLRVAFGNTLEDALQGIVQSKNQQAAIRAIIERYRKAGVELSEVDAAEELVAMMAERDPRLGIVQRVIAAIRQGLRRLGLVRQYTDQDIIYSFILPARHALRRKAIKDPRRRARADQRERARFALYWYNRRYREEFARREERMAALHAELNDELNRRRVAFEAAVRRLREAGRDNMIDSVRAVFEDDVAELERQYRRRFDAERARFDERVARIEPGIGVREGFASVTMGDVLSADFPMIDERPAAPDELRPLTDRLTFLIELREMATGRPVGEARKEMRGLMWRHLPDEEQQTALRNAVADVARELGLPPMEVVFAHNYFDIPEEARYRTPVDLIMDAIMIVWDGKLYIMEADKVHVDDVRYFMVRDAIMRSGLALALGPELGDALDALFHNALFHDEVVRTAEHYGLDLSTPFRRQMATQLALIESYLRDGQLLPTGSHGLFDAMRRALRRLGLVKERSARDLMEDLVIPAMAALNKPAGELDQRWRELGDRNTNARFSLFNAIPETIDVDGVQRPTRNSEGDLIYEHVEGIRAFWRWFGDSKVVDDEGRPLVLYHAGTFNPFAEGRDVFEPRRGGIHFGTYRAAYDRAVLKYLVPDETAAFMEEAMRYGEAEVVDEEGELWMEPYDYALELDKEGNLYVRHLHDDSRELVAHADEYHLPKGVLPTDRLLFVRRPDVRIYPYYLRIENPIDVADHGNDEGWAMALRDMRRQGGDGLAYVNEVENAGDYSYVIPSSAQAKLARGNYGWFRRDDPRPRYSLLKPDQMTITVDGVERPTRNSEGMPIHFTVEGVMNFWRWFGDSKAVDKEGRPLVLYHAGTFDPYDHEAFAELRNGIHFGTQRAAIERLFAKWAGRPILMPEKVQGETMLRIQPVTVDDRLERAFYVKPGEVKETFIDDDGSIMVRLSENRGGKVVRVMAPNTYVEVEGDLPGPYVSRHYDVVEGKMKVGVWAYYLRITNPVRLIGPSRRGRGVNDWAEDIAEAREQGYDGAIYSNDYEDYGSESWIAFAPEQVKAATINTGAFSPTDVRVRYSLPPHVAAAAKAGAPLPQGRPPRWAHRYGHLREGVGLYERAEPILAAMMAGAAPQHPVDRELFDEYAGWRAHADDVINTVTGTTPARVVPLRRFDRPRHMRSAVLVANPAVTEPQANGLSLVLTATAPRWHGGADVMVVDGVGTGPAGELVFAAVESIRAPQATSLMRRVNKAIQAAAKEAGTQIDVELLGWNGGARGGMVAFTAATPEARQMVLAEMRAAGLKPTFVTRAALHHHGKSRHTDVSAVRGHDEVVDGMADVAETMARRHLDPASLLADDPFVRNNMMAAALISALTRKGLTADEAIEAASAMTGIPKAAMRAFYHHVQNVVEMRRAVAGRLVRLPLLGTLLNRYLRYKANLPEEVRHLDMLRRGSREYTLREAADLSKRLEEMLGDDERLRTLAADYLEGNVRREHFDAFTESQRKTLDEMRTLIDRLSVALLTGRGTANPAVLDNIGKHLSRVYGIFLSEDRGGLPAIIARLKGRPTLEDFAFDNLDAQVRQTAIDEMILLRADKYLAEYEEYVQGGGTLSEAQYMRKRAEEELRLLLNKYQVNDAPFAGAATDKRSIDTSLLRRRKMLPPAMRQALGEVEDVVGRFYYTVYHMSLSAYNALAMHTIASIGAGTFLYHPDIHADIPPEYAYPIAPSGSGPWRPLAGWYTSKDIRNDLRDSMRIVHDVGDWLYGLMRRAAAFINWHNTVGSIPTQARNFVGNFEYVLNNGWLSPTDWYDVARWLAGKEGRTNIVEALVQAAQQFNVVGQNIDINVLRTLTDHKPELLFKAVVLKSRGTPVSKAAKILGIGQDLLNTMYRVGDDFFKMLGFIVEARRYARAVYGRSYGQLADAERAVVNNYAANVVKSLLPNYDAIGKVQRVLAVNPLVAQFTTFQFEALRTWHNYWTLIAYEWSQGGRMRELAVRRMAWWAASSAMRRGLTAAIAKGANVMVVGWFRHVAGLVGSGGDEDEDKLALAIRHMMPRWADDRTLVPLFWSGYRLIVYDMNSVEPSARIEEFLNILSDRPVEEWPRQMLSNMAEFVAPTITTEMFIDAKEEWERLRTLPAHQRAIRIISDMAVRGQGTLRAFVSAAKKSESGQEMMTKLGLKALGFNTYEIDPVMHVRRLLSSLFDYQNGDIARIKRQAKKEIMRAPTPEAKEAIRLRTEEYIRSRLDMLIKEVELARTFVAAVPDPEAREQAELAIRDALMGGYLSRMEKAYVLSGGESEFIFYVRGQ